MKKFSLRPVFLNRRHAEKSMRARARRFYSEFVDSVNLLESRLLLAVVTISSSADLAPYFDSANNTFNISLGQDSLEIASNTSLNTLLVNNQSSSIIIYADTVSIGSNVSIVTDGYSNSTMSFDSGNISINGRNVTIGDNVCLSANGANDSLDGDITLVADKQVKATLGFNNYMEIEDFIEILGNQSATLALGNNSRIVAGNVTMKALSGDPQLAQAAVSVSKFVYNLLAASSGHPNFLGLPLSVESWSPYSGIIIGESSGVQASNKIDVSAETDCNASGESSWYALKSMLGFAMGFYFTDARANISISPGANLQATGNVSISSDVTNSINLFSMAAKNGGISPTNPNAIDLTFGVGRLQTNSEIYVQAGSSVTSSDGLVSINATAADTNRVTTQSRTYRDGLTTVSIGMMLTDANCQVIIDGTVSSGAAKQVNQSPVAVVFDQLQAVDLVNNQINFPAGAMPFTTGQALIFGTENGSTIPGLIPGQVYYAIVNANQPNSVKLASTQENAKSGINIVFPRVYPTLTIGELVLPITTVDNIYSNAILYTFSTLPDGSAVLPGGNGTTVNYTPAAGQFIGINDANGTLIGPLPAGDYTVNLFQWPSGSTESSLYPLAIQLLNSQGQVMNLNPNSYFSTADGTIYQVSLFSMDTSSVDFNFQAPPDNPSGLTPLPVPNQQVNLTNGQPLVYTSGLVAPIGNLTNNQTYWAVVNPNTPGVIQLAASPAQSQAANPAIQNALPQLQTVANQACIESSVVDSFSKPGQSSTLTLNSGNIYTLSNNASGGTFQLTLNGPDGSSTTTPLAYNISAADLQAELNTIPGIVASVSPIGTVGQQWSIAIVFNFEIGNFENNSDLIFDINPNLADGTAVVFLEAQSKPVPGLVNGQTYYAFNQINSNYISQFPQFILTLKTSNNSSAPDVSIDLLQSMTDSLGNSYAIMYQDAGAGQISLELPVVTAPAIANGTELTAGTVNANSLLAPALALYTVASSGTFTISVSETNGSVTTKLTTVPIAWNADAGAVQLALNSLAGINVQVVGQGMPLSPWTVMGLASTWSVSCDNTNLKDNGKPTGVVLDYLAENTQQVWLAGATGGTFTVTLNFGGNQLVTKPLPYNANTATFTQAINAQGFQASVFGTGTASDPWQFLVFYNAIQNGDALIFNDTWNSDSLGMINGQTYYAVPSAMQYSAGEVMISLSASQAGALASPPLLLEMQSNLIFQGSTTGVMSGPAALVTVPSPAMGVQIAAELTSWDFLTNRGETGHYPPVGGFLRERRGKNPFDIYGLQETKEGLESDRKVLSELMRDDFASLEEKEPVWKMFKNSIEKTRDYLKEFDYKSPDSFLEAALGLSTMAINNNSQVIIGSQAKINSGNTVSLKSGLVEQFHARADSGVARTTESASKKGNLATSLGLAMALLDNTSQVIVQPNAEINAAGQIDIDSNISYPFAWNSTNTAILISNWQNNNWLTDAGSIVGIIAASVGQAIGGSDAGMGNWLFNSSSNSYTSQNDKFTKNLLGSAIGGSVVIVEITNNNLAQVCDGAQINQAPDFDTAAEQGLSISATTVMDQISGAGQLEYFINVAGIYGKHPVGTNGSQNLIGGSVNVLWMDNSSQALIGGNAPQTGNFTANTANGPTNINYGIGGLTLDALTEINYITLSQSGGKAAGIGLEASVAVISAEHQNSTAAILSAANAPVIRNMAGTAGNISISADDDSMLVSASGGILLGKAINLGFSSSAVQLNRNVSAFIGSGNTSVPQSQATWPLIQSGGNLTISGTAGGKIVPVSLAGSVITRGVDEKGKDLPGIPGKKFGFGVSGDYSEAIVSDSIYSGISGGNITGIGGEAILAIQATNDTLVNVATGSASLEFGKNAGGGLGGAGSYTKYSSTVNSGIYHVNLSGFGIELDAMNAKKIGTFAAGLDGASVAGLSVQVAGSVAINQITNETMAVIANTTGSSVGDVNLRTVETDEIWAGAGTITFITSIGSKAEFDPGKLKTKIGLGLGFAQNQLDSTTNAVISDSSLSQSTGGLKLNAQQVSSSFVLSAGTVFEAGKGTGITVYGMVALNQYSNANVKALVVNSQITSNSIADSAGMIIAAQLVPIMITAAGDLGLGIAWKTGEGAEVSIGAGVAVSQVSITGNSVASVSNSNIVLTQGNLSINAYSGQSANDTYLNNTLTNLNLPPSNYNLYSLAIAGGLSTAFDPVGELAVGINGVGAGIGSNTLINTIANISTGSEVQLTGKNQSGGMLSVNATENMCVYDNAGGASIDISISKSTSIGIVVGIGAGVHTGNGSVIASVTNSNVTTAGSMNVSANCNSSVNLIGFGVALDAALTSSGGVGFAFSASSATGKITSTIAIGAEISGGFINNGGNLTVTSTDNSKFYCGLGSGSLSVSFGEESGASLSAGASVGSISPSHTISAIIGTTDINSISSTYVNSCGSVTVSATNHQTLTAQTIAVASSIAIGGEASVGIAGAGANACITTNNNITAGIINGVVLNSNQATGSQAISVLAVNEACLTSTVGTGALDVAIAEIPVGASLGISLSQIINNDQVNALVEGARLWTAGGDVNVSAVGNSTHFSKSVATTISISLGVAGAGGNSNIYDNSNITSSVGGNTSVSTGTMTTGYGSLSINANSSENIIAQIFGGTGGIGSIGFFMSEASRTGSTNAILTSEGILSVGDLYVMSVSNQTIISEGMSVTVGGLAGTGEEHQVRVTERILTNINGSGTLWQVNGNLTILAKSDNDAMARSSGAGNGGASINVGELGAGYFNVGSVINPTVNLNINDVSLNAAGITTIGSVAVAKNQAVARAGSGSEVGGDAAESVTDNSPAVSLSTTNFVLNSAKTIIFTGSCLTYTTLADSLFAAIAGGSAALAYNNSAPGVSLSLGAGTSVRADGSVIISSINNVIGMGEGDSSKAGGIMARVGSGSVVGGYGATSSSCLTANSAIYLADGVSVSAAGRGSIQIGSTQNWVTNQLSYVNTGSAAGGSNIQSLLNSCLTNNVEIGSGVSLSAPDGSIGIGTSIVSTTTSDCYSFTFGIVGGSSSNSQNNQCSTQNVYIGSDTMITAGGDIDISPGTDPVSQSGTFQDNYAIVTAHCSGLLVFPGTSAEATTNSALLLDVNAGAEIISDLSVNIGPQPGIASGLWYTFSNYDGGKGQTNSNSSGATQTSNFNLNGNVVAGNNHELNIVIPESGNVVTVNNQSLDWSNITGGLFPVKPQQGFNFMPFQAGYQPDYNATQLLNGLDPTSQAILEPSLSKSPVPAITLANLVSAGGEVVINAAQFSGCGTISAWSPNITITNNSPAYLLLNGIGIVNTLNMGKVMVLGGADVPGSITINQQSALPCITIYQNYYRSVGTGTDSGPAVATLGPIVNTGGSVSISNTDGAFVQNALINAQTVVISTPNSAYVVNTPNQYWGAGGNITDYWTQSNYPGYVTPGEPGQGSIYNAYSANLAATTAAAALYLDKSGAGNSLEFSAWLYNNSGIPITNFVNTNVSVNSEGDPSGTYPGKGQNWGTTEKGTGIVFFGSEIPYLWETGPVSFLNGSQQYLSQSCATGYLDTYQNAQILSVAASGYQSSQTLNIAQGTGPQYAANIGRGIYPVIPSTFPTALTNSNPQSAVLGSGVTAQQIDITALYIDINSTINIGVLSSGIQANLSASLGNYISNQLACEPSVSCITIPAVYLGGANTPLTGYYDTLGNQIVLNSLAVSGGLVAAVFTGKIISTATGKINVINNPGQNLIDNQTGYPLVIQGISSPQTQQAGIVQFNDTIANISTAYIYQANNHVQTFQGRLGSSLNNLSLISNLSGTSINYYPQANLAWQWSQQATISRNLSFSNNNNVYNLAGPGFDDSWKWGALTNGTANGNTSDENNPFTLNTESSLAILSGPVSQFTEVISAQILSCQTATTYFIDNAGYAWNYGPSTTWTWMYPTEIEIQTFGQLPACNPIAIDFSGVVSGSLAIKSDTSLLLAGNIQFPGVISLESGQNISQTQGAKVLGSEVSLTACGSLGNSLIPLNFSTNSNASLNARAETGLYLATGGNLSIGSVVAANGPVVLNSRGNILPELGSDGIYGTNISLFSANGVIGSQSLPVIIQVQSTVIENGSIIGGLITASAPESIFLSQPTGDLRVASVITNSPSGVVSISVPNGNIVDGIIPDAFDFNSGNLTQRQIAQVIESIRIDNLNSANLTVAAYEGSVDQNYLQYWTMVANQSTVGNLTLNNGVYGLQFPLATVVNGVVTLTANGVVYYQQQANQYYINTANQTSNATTQQVNNYANLIYDNAVNVFQNNLAFGSGWAALPQFQGYQSGFSFVASNETISALTYGAYDLTNSFAQLSLDALSPKGQNILGNAGKPVIQTTVLQLNAGGSIGFSSSPLEIEMTDIQSGNLTNYQKTLLAMATSAGELQYVGVNSSGQRVVFSDGNQPSNVTITGVLVQIEKPLVVNLSSSGLCMIQSGSTVNLAGSAGDLNVLRIQSSANVSILSQSDINQTQLQASENEAGWSLNEQGILGFNDGGMTDRWQSTGLSITNLDSAGIVSDSLRMTAGGSIGADNNYINITTSGELNAYARGDLFLNSIAPAILTLGEIYAGSQINLTTSGSVSASGGLVKGSVGGFGIDGTGWNLNSSANGSVSINENVLFLAQSQPGAGNISSASAFYGTPLTVDNSFVSSFIYQSHTAGSTFYFMIEGQNKSESQGQVIVGLQINTPSTSPLLQTVGLFYNGVLQDVQMPGGINFASGNAIHVVVNYNSQNNSITVDITDTVTMQTYSFMSTGINIFKALGSSEGKIGFFVSGDGEQASQSISGFSFSYGSPTIQAQSLEMSSSGQIGSASSPVLILVTGNVSADAPSGVYLLQTDGDMYVESVTSTGNISLSAPTASVINSGTSQIQASRFMKPTSVGRIGRVAADHVAVQALFSIASADRPLIIQASGLSASAIQGDICLSQTGPLTIDGPVVAGGAISIVSDSSILLASVARATRSITIETLPNFSGSSRIEIEPGASVISLTDKVSLIGGEGVSLSRGATISSMAMDGRSNVIFVSILGDIENLPPFEVSVDGDVRADRIDIVSHNNGSNHFLNLPGIIGLTHVPMVYFSGANNKTVTLDDSGNNSSNSITIENGRINTKDQIIELSAVDHVIMTLGEGADMVLVGKKTGLEQLVISAGEGDDFVSTTISATDSLIQRIDGGNGVNDLLIDSDNQSVWMKNQQVSTLQGYVEYLNQKRVVVSGTSVSNALPVANRFVFESITDGRHLTNKEYVLMLYQQILNRNATDSEQASGTRLLNRNALNREQLARRMLNSSESLQIQVNAWYITYLNRQASRQEILRNVAALRRGLSAQSLISRLLVGQEFYDRTQQMFATGSAADRYIKGLYSLAISPSDSPDNALMRFLRQNLQQQGRQGVVNQVLKSMPMGRNQSEAISIKVNHRPATSGMSVGKIGPNGLTARLLSRK